MMGPADAVAWAADEERHNPTRREGESGKSLNIGRTKQG
jgi:hypothetical protein